MPKKIAIELRHGITKAELKRRFAEELKSQKVTDIIAAGGSLTIHFDQIMRKRKKYEE
jgi:hypothetical protein